MIENKEMKLWSYLKLILKRKYVSFNKPNEIFGHHIHLLIYSLAELASHVQIPV